jgi:hypothetical protein
MRIIHRVLPLVLAASSLLAAPLHAADTLIEQTMAQQPPATHIFADIAIGDLVKLANDNDPKTLADSVVYYFDRDWKRHPFPNQRVFDSWYADFSRVKVVTPEQMAEMRLGSPVTYRPGTRLVKIPSIPKVYAVEPGGVLRWITEESVAIGIYGPEWSKRVDDVSESFFIGYREGVPLRTASYPTGTVLRLKDTLASYYVDGSMLRSIDPTKSVQMRFQSRNAIEVSALPAWYAEGGALTENNYNLTDTAQITYMETLPPPQADFPERDRTLLPGADRIVASVRVEVGEAVRVRRLAVALDGAWSGSTALLGSLRLVDRATGENYYGTRELASSGAASETVTFEGSATLAENKATVIDLVATVASEAAGKTVAARFVQETSAAVNGTNDAIAVPLLPQTAWPSLTARVQ